jgi:formylmethanofuran dehydrogenase subunit A
MTIESRTEAMTEWVTTREASEIAGYSVPHVQWLVRHGKVKAVLKGRTYWVDADSLRAYLDEVARLGTQRFNWRRKRADG